MEGVRGNMLVRYRAKLIEKLESCPTAFSYRLARDGCITKDDLKRLDGLKDKFDKSRCILDMIHAGGQKEFDLFCNVLTDMGSEDEALLLRPQPAYYTWEWRWSKDSHIIAQGHSKWFNVDRAKREGEACRPHVTTCDCGCSGVAKLVILTWSAKGDIILYTPSLAEISPQKEPQALPAAIRVNQDEATRQYIGALEDQLEKVRKRLREADDKQAEQNMLRTHTDYKANHASIYNPL